MMKKEIDWKKFSWIIFGVCAFFGLFFGLWETEWKSFTDSSVISGMINEVLFILAVTAAARFLPDYRGGFRYGIPGDIVGSGFGAFIKLSHDSGFVDAFTWSMLSSAALLVVAVVLWGTFVHVPGPESGS